ncbi:MULTISPECIES: general secretion pathway protein GspK [unclassified Wenzhouxiangella]|uniref:general secretion pathway protein GspK n=1 Tax=unclassified Wenzhouxiangella TaxID=2613841 RepID=UPI000E3289F1|nr:MULTISPECIES: type II secretion system protein GspK [unclassified Wenzhouxiangella]RFF26536.1 general secretion pathway protein GspK [Wenzhouxiangella sp. 15181]RFP67525.1 general secretion pathway protein GspK [Wenzhouxiangella sp. 15190]
MIARPGVQRGIALIVVLWILVLLTIVVGTYAVLARTESLQARFLLDTTRARYAAEAGIHRAAFEMRNSDVETRWVPDGRPYTLEFGGAEVEIRITDESGKMDLNSTSAEELSNLFMSRGMEETEAWHLADAIEDWRDEDDLPRLYGAELIEYESAGYPYGPANEPFASVDELQQVIGMSWDLFRELEPMLTVHSRGRINPAFASADVLAADPEITAEDAAAFVEERRQFHPRDQQALFLPNGQTVSLQGGGRTFSIRSRATLDSGTWNEVQATIELGGDQRGRPFRVLRWRDNVEDR